VAMVPMSTRTAATPEPSATRSMPCWSRWPLRWLTRSSGSG
jgi:hypothetical protein